MESRALSELLSPSVIKASLEGEDKEEVLEELVDLLVRAGKVKDRARALAAILAREEQQSTGIGNAVAIPHGKDESIEQLACALGMSEKGVEFESLDGKPAHVVFLVLAEAHNAGPHVALLAGISRVLREPGFIRKLRDAGSAEEAISAIRGTEEEMED